MNTVIFFANFYMNKDFKYLSTWLFFCFKGQKIIRETYVRDENLSKYMQTWTDIVTDDAQ